MLPSSSIPEYLWTILKGTGTFSLGPLFPFTFCYLYQPRLWTALYAEYRASSPTLYLHAVAPGNLFSRKEEAKQRGILTPMGIPNHYRCLYSLHLSAQSPSTNPIKLTTIRPDGKVGALLIIHSLVFSVFVFLFLLVYGEAIRWVSGACPAPDPVVLNWIKLASFVTVMGDAGGYTRLVWFWCLGLAWLELQVFREFFPRTQFPSLPL